MSTLPYLPFARPTLDEDTINGVTEVLRSGWITTGPQVKKFEAALSVYLGDRPVRVLNSATAALEVALQLCGIGPGDEVITPAQTFFAAPNMIAKVGAKPVFVDVELISRNLDFNAVEQAITPRTKAIMPTHFGGLPVDMDRLYAIAGKYGLRMIEDAALAMGSSWRGRRIGSFGDLTVFSFHPNKNMTSIEGGALVLADEAEALEVETLRFHGITRLPDGTRDVAFPGGKFNLPDVNARIGLGQLARLEEFNHRRRELVADYFRLLQTDPPCLLPHPGYPGDESGHSWNLFAPLLPLDQLRIDRSQFRAALESRGIGTGISYEAAHLTTLFRGYGHRDGELPNTERIARETVTLPLFPTMTRADVERVCATVNEVLAEAKR
ncbi:MAG: DegT/DnrJ/EryC1/StrS aminotransferase family protein [Candidatus Contendobacter sp.]|jgi:dTDP-4-amino-4,6-dideoxygalactose transaminase|nr:DegT/DnrJ/EryC1/StrS aminotransferase family protein [Gammaproteobacteria bacterium]MCC8992413.1 DegT/DnrJ/EryC1/StrS aminotransferase family protein [Candidatus Contendobacter sp.]